jgi:hypothetical protein
MGFYEVLAQGIALLQREGHTLYRALKRQFRLDDDSTTSKSSVLTSNSSPWIRTTQCWSGRVRPPPPHHLPCLPRSGRSCRTRVPTWPRRSAPLTRSALGGERKQVTVLFTDLKDSPDAPKKPIWRRSGRATPVRNSLCLCAYKHMRGVIALTVACQKPSYLSKCCARLIGVHFTAHPHLSAVRKSGHLFLWSCT